MKFVYTRPEDGGVSVVVPAPKADLEWVLGPLTDEEYRAHVLERSIPPDALNVREISDDDLPDREFRNAWCDVTPESSIDIHSEKAKELALDKLRLKRQEKFNELGFPIRLHPEVEKAIVSPATQAQLKELRDVTESLKGIEPVLEHNDTDFLEQISILSKQLDD